MPSWLHIEQGEAPLVVSIPHAGQDLLPEMERQVASAWLARKDTDWYVDQLYDFAPSLGVTIVRTTMSRSVIDVNRDPSGKSLYPGQATTELCPTTTFDGEALYRASNNPTTGEISRRRRAFFDPYHAALHSELERLKTQHGKVVLFEAHSIRSLIPRLFEGVLPDFNIGTNSGESCDSALTAAVEAICDATGFTRVSNGRFKGGWTTRHYGKPEEGVHAIQLELACRCYLHEPNEDRWASATQYNRDNWPSPYDEAHATLVREALYRILRACIRIASTL